MLSLINVQVTANVSAFESALDRAAGVAETSMGQAASATERWQSKMDQAANAAGNSADAVAARFDAANDAIMRSAEQSAEAMSQVEQSVNDVDMSSWAEKTAKAFGAGFGGGYALAETYLEKLEQFVEAKLVIAGIAIATGVSAAAISAVYAAYKAGEFITGLFTGDSYKSENIDALIKTTDSVSALQDALGLAAPRAQALGQALSGIGMSQSDYIAVTEKTRLAVESNTDELDRLGVKYKDADGNLLPLIETQRNALEVIQSYREGMDRVQAAQSIGMGLEKDLQSAVQATSERVDVALDRLVAYNLVVGEGSLEAVGAYQSSMRAFQQETDLTSQGLKRAIADQVMPLFTDLSDFFRDGFPGVVRAFRYSMATVTTLFYGLKEAAFLTGEGVIQSFGAIGDVTVRVATALGQAMRGEFQAAVNTLMQAPGDLGNRWQTFLDNAAAQSERNIKAVKLAWGADNFDAREQIAAYGNQQQSKKSWVAAPKKEAEEKKQRPLTVRLEEDPAKALLDSQVKSLDRAIQDEATLLAQREAMLKTYFDRGDISAADYYQRLDDIRADALANTRRSYDQEFALIESYLAQQEAGSQKAIDAAEKLSEAQNKAARAVQASSFANTKTWLEQDTRTASAGYQRFLASVEDSATNTGRIVESAFTNAFSSMEDAMVQFTRTGKLDFKSLADSIISDLLRIQVRQQLAGFTKLASTAIGSFFSSGSTVSDSTQYSLSSGNNLSSMGGGTGLKLPSYDVGTDYVPQDMIAMIHKGEAIIPADQNRGYTGGPLGAAAAPQSVRVELVNQTSQPSQAVSATPSFDADGMVVNIVLRDLKNNGPIRQALGA